MTAPPPPPGPPVTTMDEAITRMQAIDAALPATDGVACFNRMYLEVTQKVAADVSQNFFADPVFLTSLDVVFFNLYLDAVNAMSASPDDLPVAWAPLLNARGNTNVESIQFALAGMNSHINHDLPIALVTTCSALALAPDDGSHHADYQKVDVLLDAAEQSIRESFESGVVLDADRHTKAVVNLVAGWSITAARDVAWDTAVTLWTIRHIGVARDLLLSSLARTVATASCTLLAAV